MAYPRLQKESEGSLALTVKLGLKACGSDLAVLQEAQRMKLRPPITPKKKVEMPQWLLALA